jgi:hypothetical protein
MTQAKSLYYVASAGDKQQLDEYYEAVRKAEHDIYEAQVWMDRPKPIVDKEPPVNVPDRTELVAKTRLLLNMVPLILQTDSSRVVTLMIHDHTSVPNIAGVTGEHHNLSHHGRDPDKIAQLRKIESGLVSCLDDLLTELKLKDEGDGTLLDTTSVLFGSNLGNANAHDSRNLPILLAGGGFKHGGFVPHDEHDNAPLCNLFLTMLNNMGIEAETFSQSTGAMSW